MLYPIADNVLSHNGIKEIERLFCDIENDEAKKGIHERYHDLALKISGRSTGD